MVNLLLLGVFSNVPEYLLRGLTKTLTCTKNKALSSIFPKMNGWSLLSTPLPSWVPHRSAVLRGMLLEALWCTAAPPQVKVDGKVVLSLLGMPRPFTALKALDMEEEGKKVWHARQLG